MGQAKYHIEKTCPICGRTFRAKTLDSQYCSRICGNAAYRKKKRVKAYQTKLDNIEKRISDTQEYLSVKQAVSVYGVSRETLYRLIRTERIPYINMGTRLIRLRRSDIEERFERRSEVMAKETKPLPKLYRLEPENCYTVSEVSEHFKVSASTVYSAIRRYSIPMRQIGKNVYIPKNEMNNIFDHNLNLVN